MTDQKGPPPQDRRERRVRSSKIGRQLKRLYDDVINEDVPDDFLKLLEEADKKRSSSEKT